MFGRTSVQKAAGIHAKPRCVTFFSPTFQYANLRASVFFFFTSQLIFRDMEVTPSSGGVKTEWSHEFSRLHGLGRDRFVFY